MAYNLEDIIGNPGAVSTPDNPAFGGGNSVWNQYFGPDGRLRWSPNNPFAIQIPYARDRQNAQDLADKAVEWESNFGNALLTRVWQLEDREHDEDYNSPAAQVSRLRAAGINPDIQGGVDGVATQSQSAPAPAATQNDVADSTEREQTDIAQFGTIFGSSVQLAQLALNAMNFCQGIPLQQANIKRAQISNDILQDSADQLGYENWRASVPDALMLSRSAVDASGGEIPTLDAVNDLLSSTPYNGNPDFASFVHRLAGSPNLRNSVVESLNNLNRGQAYMSAVGKLNFNERFTTNALQLQLHQQVVDEARLAYQDAYNKAIVELRGADIAAQRDVSSAEFERDSNYAMIDHGVPDSSAAAANSRNQLIQKNVRDAFTVYERALTSVKSLISQFDSQIAEIEAIENKSPEQLITLDALRFSRCRAYVYGAEQFTHFFEDARNFSYQYQLYNTTVREKSPTRPGYKESNWFTRSSTFNGDLEYLNYTFDKYIAEPADGSSLVDAALKLIPF